MNYTLIDVFAGVILAAMGVLLLALIVIAHRYVEAIEAYFPNSQYIEDNRRNWSWAGLQGKVTRMGNIGMVVIMPGMYVRRGLVDPREISELPRTYKALLVVPLLMSFFLSASLAVLSLAF